jgi:TatD DNase family protein
VWFDSHCHLQDDPDPHAALERAAASAVDRVVCVGTDAAHSRRGLEIAGTAAGRVWATIGLHPHSASEGTKEALALLEEVAAGPVAERLVAVGECGLDYHYDHSPRADQREAFAAQVAAANRLGLTLVVHTREAWDDTFGVLVAEGLPPRTVFHCFTGGPAEATRCLDLGGYLSFSGIVTFKSAAEVREAAALCPADRLLVETDSPYLAPVPHRGRRNEPSLLPYVGAGVAQARGEPAEVVARRSAVVTAEVFGIGAADAPTA